MCVPCFHFHLQSIVHLTPLVKLSMGSSPAKLRSNAPVARSPFACCSVCLLLRLLVHQLPVPRLPVIGGGQPEVSEGRVLTSNCDCIEIVCIVLNHHHLARETGSLEIHGCIPLIRISLSVRQLYSRGTIQSFHGFDIQWYYYILHAVRPSIHPSRLPSVHHPSICPCTCVSHTFGISNHRI